MTGIFDNPAYKSKRSKKTKTPKYLRTGKWQLGGFSGDLVRGHKTKRVKK